MKQEQLYLSGENREKLLSVGTTPAKLLNDIFLFQEQQDHVSKAKHPNMPKTSLITYKVFRLKQFISEETPPVILLFSSFLQERMKTDESIINLRLHTEPSTERTDLGKLYDMKSYNSQQHQILQHSKFLGNQTTKMVVGQITEIRPKLFNRAFKELIIDRIHH